MEKTSLNPLIIHNKNAAAIQITADQLILESVSRMKDRPRLPEVAFQTQEEIKDVQFKRRQAWELNVRRNLCTYNTYIRYARWEEGIGSLENARAIYERALEFTRCREPAVWDAYIDLELRHQAVNHARNILERAITILPRYDHFWLKYSRILEELGNIEGAREIFQRWIAWEPPASAFLTFAEFEARVHEFTRARSIFERLLLVHPFADSYIRYADFEIKLRQPGRARAVFERGLEALGVENINESLMLRFAAFEESENEIERARALYKLAITKLPETHAREIRTEYLQFEKRYGGQTQIEDAVLEKKRAQYMEMLEANPLEYDIWFELCNLLQDLGNLEDTRDAYKKASETKPPVAEEKSQWSRYVLLCLSWAVFEEKRAKNPENARAVYAMLKERIPHKKFTFARFWRLYAFFEVRQGNLHQARLIFGEAIGRCPRPSIFSAYVEMEKLLGETGNVVEILKKYIEKIPSDVRAWVSMAEVRFKNLGSIDDARQVFEDAINSGSVDAIDLLWACYIDFESKVGTIDNARELYKRSIAIHNKLSLWEGWIMLEADVCDDLERARQLFDEAELALKDKRNDRRKLRFFRVEFEKQFGSDETVELAESRLPTVNEEDGTFVFPEEGQSAAMALMEQADLWAQGF